ncbi:MAG: chromosomal replication initiator protein DnaA [Planctomycetota bacterium]
MGALFDFDAPLPQVFDVLRERLRSSFADEQFVSWFDRFELLRVQPERVTFAAPNSFIRQRFQSKYRDQLESVVRDTLGEPGCEVSVLVPEQPRFEANGLAAESGLQSEVSRGVSTGEGIPSGSGPSNGHLQEELPANGTTFGAQGLQPEPVEVRQVGNIDSAVERFGWASSELGSLNAGHTFDNFVVGPCNRLSHAAALAVKDNPGRTYNPLFLHGNVGLGKTHLLQSVCHAIREQNPKARVLYISCEEFTNRFIHSIQARCLDLFRAFHRSVDVLVIDDVQFLADKEKTQDEFFHTFNVLYNTQRQIILSSDRSPSDIPTVEERLLSRFRWGLVAELDVPCFETRVAIVKRKALSRRVQLPDDVAYFIAERIDTNIRELEGAIIKVVGVATITQRPIDTALAEEALRGVVVSRRSRKLSVPDIVQAVTEHFAVTTRDLTGKSRTQAISVPRQLSMYLCRELTDESLESVGRYFGNRDHTTVMYGVQKIKDRITDDPSMAQLVATLRRRLTGG